MLQFFNSLGGVFLNHIGGGYNPQEDPVPFKENRRFSFSPQCPGEFCHILRYIRQRGNIGFRPAVNRVPVHNGGKAVSRKNPESGGFFRTHASFFRLFHNGPGKGMLGFPFQRIRQKEKFIVRHMSRRINAGHFRLPFRNGTGLVKRDNLYFSRIFKRFACFEKNAVFRAYAAADHNGNGRCQSQRAGTGNDEDADGVFQCFRHGRAEEYPHDHDENGYTDNGRYKDGGHGISDSCNRRFCSGRIADHADDL